MLDRTLPPVSNPVSTFDFTKATTQYTDNGIPVHIINTGNHDIIRVEIILKSGKWFETVEGSSFFCCKMMMEGTRQRSSHQLAEFFDQYGAFFQVHPGLDFVNFTLYTINRHLATLLPVVFEVITQPDFPGEELEILKNIKIQQLKVDLEKNDYVASNLFRESVFGADHTYGGSFEIDKINTLINRDVLMQFYKDSMIMNPEIIVSGNIKEKDIKLILSLFNDLKYRTIKNPKCEMTYTTGEKRYIEKADSVQVSLRYGNHIMNKVHEDYVDFLILNEILGGYFGSRLMKTIREEKGYTYGIYSGVVSMLNEAYFVIGSDIKKEFSEQAVEVIIDEMDKLKHDEISLSELDTVKNYMSGTFLSSLETSFALADRFTSIYFYGLDYSYYEHYLNRITHITPQRIQELAAKYLISDSFNLVMVG